MIDIFKIFRDKSEQGPRHTVMNRLRGRLDLATSREDISLRFGQEEDLSKLVELEVKAYKGYQAWHLSDFTYDWQKNPHGVYLILEQKTRQGQARMIGMMNGRFRAQGGHISHIIVDPDYHGQGLGKFLLTKWFECAHLLGTPKITLEVRQSNYRAQNLYHQFGFIKGSTKRFYYADNHEDAYEMVCYLKRRAYED